MAQHMKMSFCVMVIVFSTFACGQLQPPIVTPAPSSTTTFTPTLELAPALTTTHTLVPLTSPTTTATQSSSEPQEDIGPFRYVTSLPNLLTDLSGDKQVRALDEGSVWIITNQVAMRWENQTWEEVVSESEGMLADVDDDGRLWVLGQDTSEITVWKDGQWTTYSAANGWTSASTSDVISWWTHESWSISSGAAGTVWLPMAQDVRDFDGKRWSLYTLAKMGFPSPAWEDISVGHVLAMQGGGAEVWVGECYYSGPGPMGGQGVRWFDGKIWYGADAPVGPTCVSAMEVDSAGNVWLGAYDVVWRYGHADQAWTPYYLPKAFLLDYNFSYPQHLIVDHAGDAWVIMQLCGGASCSGPAQLYRIHEGEWTLIIDSQDAFLPLKQLALDGSGQGWLFWDGMVYRLEGESMNPIAPMDALSVDVSPERRVWALANYKDDNTLWILEP